MIVISGALVLVALVLLVLGLTMTDLDFVYGSIGVSLVSFVFLVIGILQRRGEPAGSPAPTVSDDAAEPARDTTDGDGSAAETSAVGASGRPVPQHVPAVTTAAGATTARAGARTPAVEEVDDEELLPGGGPVLVVEGRPRYHVEGCRYLTGRTVEELDVLDAQDDGFTACGVCKPDQVLEELYGPLDEVEGADQTAAPAAEPAEASDADAPSSATARRGRSTGTATVALDAPAAAGAKTGSKASSKASTKAGTKAGKASSKAGPKAAGGASARTSTDDTTTAGAAAPAPAKAAKAPAKASPAKAGAARTGAAKTGAAKTGAAKTGAAAMPPAQAAPVEKAPAAQAAAAPAASARGKVVVIPDRDRFHVATCRFVRDTDGTEQLTRAQADKQGYRACGVCKP